MNSAIRQYLVKKSQVLAEPHGKLRMRPLILLRAVDDFLSYARSFFDSFDPEKAPYGYSVRYVRRLPSRETVQGSFDLLTVAQGVMIVCSHEESRADQHGPRRLVEQAHPRARRPFVASSRLRETVDRFASEQDLETKVRNTTGYNRRSGAYFQDREPMSPEDCVRKHQNDGKHVHRMEVHFRSAEDGDVLRASIARDCSSTVYKGDPLLALEHLILPMTRDVMRERKRYEIPRSTSILNQQMVEIVFDDKPFADRANMEAVCAFIQAEEGLNLTVNHLNPYLHAQVLDFYAGGSLQVVITDSQTVNLVPLSGQSALLLEKTADIIMARFGEGAISFGSTDPPSNGQ